MTKDMIILNAYASTAELSSMEENLPELLPDKLTVTFNPSLREQKIRMGTDTLSNTTTLPDPPLFTGLSTQQEQNLYSFHWHM